MSEKNIPGSSCGKAMPEDKSAFSIMVFEQVRAHAKMSWQICPTLSMSHISTQETATFAVAPSTKSIM